MDVAGVLDNLEQEGFAVVPDLLPRDEVIRLRDLAEQALGPDPTAGTRHALSRDWVQVAAADPRVRRWPESHLGSAALAVRAILFDKQPGANWNLGFHQDRVVALAARGAAPGFVGWSEKEGVVHALAPAEVLDHMMAVRLSLDDCGADNGPLRVLPGTHRSGLLSRQEVEVATRNISETVCTCFAGDAVLMKPLLLHASSQATSPSHRRVLHIEFSIPHLPGGLSFHDWS